MRKAVYLLFVIGLLVAMVTPVMAAGGPPHQGTPPGQVGKPCTGNPSQGVPPAQKGNAQRLCGPFNLVGTITGIGDSTVTVQVASGNRLVKDFIGQTLTIQTTPSTRYLLRTSTETVPITFADLQVGQKVSVQGTLADGVWTARRITVGAALIHKQ